MREGSDGKGRKGVMKAGRGGGKEGRNITMFCVIGILKGGGEREI